MLLIALAGLELAFDLLAIDAVAPLLAASPAAEHQIGSDLIAVAVIAPRFQERCHPFDPSIRGLEDMTNASLQRGR